MQFITLFIVFICLLNLVRMAAYLITSDLYSLFHQQRRKKYARWHLPTISVVIPAHNEEKVIERALLSLYESDYPASKYEIIVANDGSTDKTAELVRAFKKQHRDKKIRLINRQNRGKAAVLNYVIRNCAHGSLIMCLDADSSLAPSSLRNAAQHFRDRNVIALSSNVNIIEDGSILALLQRYEYLVCYQMKKGQALLDVEYIIGGIGSMFRASLLKRVGHYDTNTMTEDIDLTMKILATKRRNERIAYAADSIAYTEAAHTFKELLRQRYRWKFGRSQAFLKHNDLFFSGNSRVAKRLGWFALPFALLQDAIYSLEPLVIAYFVITSLLFHDDSVFLSALIVITMYLLANIWSSDHVAVKDRLRLSYYAPFMYVLMYVLSAAEYYALIKASIELPTLRDSIQSRHVTWTSPTRASKLT